MTARDEFSKELQAGRFQQALATALTDAIELHVVTWVSTGDGSDWSQGEERPSPGKRMQTRINILEGDVEHEIGREFLDGAYSELRDFHDDQVKRGFDIIHENLRTVQHLFQVLVQVRQGRRPSSPDASTVELPTYDVPPDALNGAWQGDPQAHPLGVTADEPEWAIAENRVLGDAVISESGSGILGAEPLMDQPIPEAIPEAPLSLDDIGRDIDLDDLLVEPGPMPQDHPEQPDAATMLADDPELGDLAFHNTLISLDEADAIFDHPSLDPLPGDDLDISDLLYEDLEEAIAPEDQVVDQSVAETASVDDAVNAAAMLREDPELGDLSYLPDGADLIEPDLLNSDVDMTALEPDSSEPDSLEPDSSGLEVLDLEVSEPGGLDLEALDLEALDLEDLDLELSETDLRSDDVLTDGESPELSPDFSPEPFPEIGDEDHAVAETVSADMIDAAIASAALPEDLQHQLEVAASQAPQEPLVPMDVAEELHLLERDLLNSYTAADLEAMVAPGDRATNLRSLAEMTPLHPLPKKRPPTTPSPVEPAPVEPMTEPGTEVEPEPTEAAIALEELQLDDELPVYEELQLDGMDRQFDLQPDLQADEDGQLVEEPPLDFQDAQLVEELQFVEELQLDGDLQIDEALPDDDDDLPLDGMEFQPIDDLQLEEDLPLGDDLQVADELLLADELSLDDDLPLEEMGDLSSDEPRAFLELDSDILEQADFIQAIASDPGIDDLEFESDPSVVNLSLDEPMVDEAVEMSEDELSDLFELENTDHLNADTFPSTEPLSMDEAEAESLSLAAVADQEMEDELADGLADGEATYLDGDLDLTDERLNETEERLDHELDDGLEDEFTSTEVTEDALQDFQVFLGQFDDDDSSASLPSPTDEDNPDDVSDLNDLLIERELNPSSVEEDLLSTPEPEAIALDSDSNDYEELFAEPESEAIALDTGSDNYEELFAEPESEAIALDSDSNDYEELFAEPESEAIALDTGSDNYEELFAEPESEAIALDTGSDNYEELFAEPEPEAIALDTDSNDYEELFAEPESEAIALDSDSDVYEELFAESEPEAIAPDSDVDEGLFPTLEPEAIAEVDDLDLSHFEPSAEGVDVEADLDPFAIPSVEQQDPEVLEASDDMDFGELMEQMNDLDASDAADEPFSLMDDLPSSTDDPAATSFDLPQDEPLFLSDQPSSSTSSVEDLDWINLNADDESAEDDADPLGLFTDMELEPSAAPDEPDILLDLQDDLTSTEQQLEELFDQTADPDGAVEQLLDEEVDLSDLWEAMEGSADPMKPSSSAPTEHPQHPSHLPDPWDELNS
ncbi:hypothetical protein [Leptolyngbya sp. CCY15150]|uniref:hypothetical protein n=1 Tax=Leptolyngbya sp. CCY15150 TaxID=2767772 RepID=UPI0019520132|nr:hypothetical protein [Leptolyngbya sp. CCY15150]